MADCLLLGFCDATRVRGRLGPQRLATQQHMSFPPSSSAVWLIKNEEKTTYEILSCSERNEKPKRKLNFSFGLFKNNRRGIYSIRIGKQEIKSSRSPSALSRPTHRVLQLFCKAKQSKAWPFFAIALSRSFVIKRDKKQWDGSPPWFEWIATRNEWATKMSHSTLEKAISAKDLSKECTNPLLCESELFN